MPFFVDFLFVYKRNILKFVLYSFNKMPFFVDFLFVYKRNILKFVLYTFNRFKKFP